MGRIKKILFAILVVIIAIQFIQPARNKSGQVLQTDFSTTYDIPQDIFTLVKNACYDCHSNNTNYPWYSNIQPVAWVMARHISKGKQKLNFSCFGSNTTRKKVSKLKEIANQIKDGEMPITSYKLMHKSARLSEDDKNLLMNWVLKTADSLSVNN